MEVKYKIVGINKSTGTIGVNYYCDGYDEGYLCNLDLPIDVQTKTTLMGEKLDEFIRFHAPVQQLEWAVEKRLAIAEVDFSHIEAILEPIDQNELVGKP